MHQFSWSKRNDTGLSVFASLELQNKGWKIRKEQVWIRKIKILFTSNKFPNRTYTLTILWHWLTYRNYILVKEWLKNCTKCFIGFMSFFEQWQIMNSILDGKKPLVFKCQSLTFLINCVILHIAFSQKTWAWSWEKVKVMFSTVRITKEHIFIDYVHVC